LLRFFFWTARSFLLLCFQAMIVPQKILQASRILF
jgi:hypothetical protein